MSENLGVPETLESLNPTLKRGVPMKTSHLSAFHTSPPFTSLRLFTPLHPPEHVAGGQVPAPSVEGGGLGSWDAGVWWGLRGPGRRACAQGLLCNL